MRLSQDDQTLVLCQLAEILAACEEDLKNTRPPEREQLQKQVYAVVDVSPIFFEVISSLKRVLFCSCVLLIASRQFRRHKRAI